ncbi:hypothetical protein ACWDAF_09380, partial [Streptomyces sp. NPDC001226]
AVMDPPRNRGPGRPPRSAARIAEGLRALRADRTTVVFTSSPLVLDRADRVVLVHEGRVAAVGPHRELVRDDPRYRAVVTRETDEESAARDGAPTADAPADDRLTERVLAELEEIEETA